MAFIKTTAGRACKVAELFGADWVYPSASSIVEEARDRDGCTIAYRDADGWFVHRSIASVDVTGIEA
jgi:hypothetical protein